MDDERARFCMDEVELGPLAMPTVAMGDPVPPPPPTPPGPPGPPSPPPSPPPTPDEPIGLRR